MVKEAAAKCEEHGPQWRVRDSSKSIDVLLELREKLIRQEYSQLGKMTPGQWKRNQEQQRAFWVGACRISEELSEDFDRAQSLGHLLVMFTDEPIRAGGEKFYKWRLPQ